MKINNSNFSGYHTIIFECVLLFVKAFERNKRKNDTNNEIPYSLQNNTLESETQLKFENEFFFKGPVSVG